jgi:hypothetical protein
MFGWYDGATGLTRDQCSDPIGRGNLLTTLLDRRRQHFEGTEIPLAAAIAAPASGCRRADISHLSGVAARR